MEARYTRNIGSITEEEQEILKGKKVIVAGCGGLGGYIIEFLTRVGIGHLVVCDGDVFDESNLNRQLNCTVQNLGKSKAICARERVQAVNPDTEVTAFYGMITEENAYELVKDCDLAVDALDNVSSRIILENACEKAGIPYVFGGVNKWMGSACVVMPGERTIEKIYSGVPAPKKPSVICMAVANVASIECAEAVKYLLGYEVRRGSMLMTDLKNNNFQVMPL